LTGLLGGAAGGKAAAGKAPAAGGNKTAGIWHTTSPFQESSTDVSSIAAAPAAADPLAGLLGGAGMF
jgi:hypothetical protein